MRWPILLKWNSNMSEEIDGWGGIMSWSSVVHEVELAVVSARESTSEDVSIAVLIEVANDYDGLEFEAPSVVDGPPHVDRAAPTSGTDPRPIACEVSNAEW